jgi:hypothetical protein
MMMNREKERKLLKRWSFGSGGCLGSEVVWVIKYYM